MQPGYFQAWVTKKIHFNNFGANKPLTVTLEFGNRLLQQRVLRISSAETQLHLLRHNEWPREIQVLARADEDGLLHGASVEVELRGRHCAKVYLQLTVTLILNRSWNYLFRCLSVLKITLFELIVRVSYVCRLKLLLSILAIMRNSMLKSKHSLIRIRLQTYHNLFLAPSLCLTRWMAIW